MTYNMDKELHEESMPFSQSVYSTKKTLKTNNVVDDIKYNYRSYVVAEKIRY